MHLLERKDDFRIDVESDHVVLVLPWRMDSYASPWEKAYELGKAIEDAAGDIEHKSLLLDPVAFRAETEQVAFNTHKGNVVLLFRWTDRIKFSYEAARTVGRTMRLYAQNVQYETRKRNPALLGVPGWLPFRKRPR
jgi:hypothetical protein